MVRGWPIFRGIEKRIKYRRFLITALLTPGLTLVLLSCPLQGQITLRDGWALRCAKDVKVTGEQVSSVSYSVAGWYSTSIPATVLAVLAQHGVYPDSYFGTYLPTIPRYRASDWLTRDMPQGSPFNVAVATYP